MGFGSVFPALRRRRVGRVVPAENLEGYLGFSLPKRVSAARMIQAWRRVNVLSVTENHWSSSIKRHVHCLTRSKEGDHSRSGATASTRKTIAKWRKRESSADRRTGPTAPMSTVLSVEQEAIIVAFRKHTLLPLDDCLYALQATIPHSPALHFIVVWNSMA